MSIEQFIGSVPTIKREDFAGLIANVPEGYETVGGWWAKKEVEALELLRNPLATFYGDAERLQTICEEEGIDYLWVASPPAYGVSRLTEVRAFPTSLLEEFYPSNP